MPSVLPIRAMYTSSFIGIVVRRLLHPIPNLRLMHTQIFCGLRVRHAPLSDQPPRLKLELAGKLPSLHDPPPAPSKHLTRCLRNRVQARRDVLANLIGGLINGRGCWLVFFCDATMSLLMRTGSRLLFTAFLLDPDAANKTNAAESVTTAFPGRSSLVHNREKDVSSTRGPFYVDCNLPACSCIARGGDPICLHSASAERVTGVAGGNTRLAADGHRTARPTEWIQHRPLEQD